MEEVTVTTKITLYACPRCPGGIPREIAEHEDEAKRRCRLCNLEAMPREDVMTKSYHFEDNPHLMTHLDDGRLTWTL